MLLTGCVVVAAYTGARMPSGWTATLQAVSLQDGFHRRFLVGSFLRPLAEPMGYPYGLFAAESFAVLAVLVAVLVRAASRTRNPARRLLVIAFLLLPTGGYLFHEVGYFDQTLYLMLFAAFGLLRRGRWIGAATVVALTVTVHEIAVITVLPLFLAVAARLLPWRRVVLAVAPAAALSAIILLSSPAEGGAPERLTRRLSTVRGFPVRPDALQLFDRTQAESWRLYSPLDVFLFMLPLTIAVLGAVMLFARISGRWNRRSAPLTAPALGAAVSPVVLAAAGWDKERWAFLLITNLCVVFWVWLGENETPTAGGAYVLVVSVLLLTSHVPLTYFDGFAPRTLTGHGIGSFVGSVTSGRFTATPER